MSQLRFRGNWAPHVETPTMGDGNGNCILKLCFNASIRLVEIEEPLTFAKVEDKFKELFPKLTDQAVFSYSLEGDDDEIEIVDDKDLTLARKFGTKPLKIVATQGGQPTAAIVAGEISLAPPQAAVMTGDAFEIASAGLTEQGLDVSVEQLKLLFRILEFMPGRLVKYGLAPIYALRKRSDDEDWDKCEDNTKHEDTDMSVEIKNQDIVNADDATITEAEDDAVVTVLRSRGITIPAAHLHALLRVLDVPPNRFKKLGLIDDLSIARKAYKEGGKKAADLVLKVEGAAKKWGRGLCGGRGRGRGAGWLFEQHLARHKVHKVHHHVMHHPPHRMPPHFHRGPHAHSFHGPPPHFHHGPPHHPAFWNSGSAKAQD